MCNFLLSNVIFRTSAGEVVCRIFLFLICKFSIFLSYSQINNNFFYKNFNFEAF